MADTRSVRLSVDLHKRARVRAALDDVPLQNLVEAGVLRECERRERLARERLEAAEARLVAE